MGISTFRIRAIQVAVFICGAIVMTYEIVGSRVIAPHIGTSTYTWTSLIGVILAALSLGYWLGGRWADRDPRIGILAAVVFVAGGAIAVTVLIKEPLLIAVAGAALPLEISSVIAAVFLFGPASVLLGFVAPYAVRLTIRDLEHSGRTVGSLYALSTIGSILGTFLAGFVLIPFVGTNRTLYLLAAIAFLVSFLLAPFTFERYKIGLIIIFCAAIGFTEWQTWVLYKAFNYHDIDTEYNRVRIYDTEKKGRPLRAMSIDPSVYQSSMYLDDGSSGADYIGYFHLIRHFNPGFRRGLMIGGAAYSFPKEYLKQYAAASMDVVEIDSGMTLLAKTHFNLELNKRLRIHHVDGRMFLNQAEESAYDAVFVDAFNALFSIPFHLTTVEAVQEVNEALTDDGVVLVNFASAASGNGAGFLEAIAATYRHVFPSVEIFRVDIGKDPAEAQNFVLAASRKPLEMSSEDAALSALLQTRINVANRDSQILTDYLAPVERLISIARTRSSNLDQNSP